MGQVSGHLHFCPQLLEARETEAQLRGPPLPPPASTISDNVIAPNHDSLACLAPTICRAEVTASPA